MRGFTRFLLFTLIVVIVGGGVFLATWDIPAPVAPVEVTIPDSRFPK